jgi:hypothetical protein
MRDVCKVVGCWETMDGLSSERDFCYSHRGQEESKKEYQKEYQRKRKERKKATIEDGSGYELYY